MYIMNEIDPYADQYRAPNVLQLSVTDERQYLGVPGEPTQLNPYLIAENFPVEQLERVHVSRKNLIGKFWQAIEIALTSGDEESIQEIRQEVENMSHNRDINPVVRARSAMLASNAGLLTLRAMGVEPKSKQIRKSARSMSHALGRLRRSEYGKIDTSNFMGIQAEMMAYNLIALNGDSDFVPYVAGPREESSRAKDANHDLYTLRFGASAKIPTQVKLAQIAPRGFVMPLSLRATLERSDAGKELGTNPVNNLAQLIVLDRDQHFEVDTEEGRILHLAANSVLRLIKEHKDYIARDHTYKRPPYSVHHRTFEDFQASF